MAIDEVAFLDVARISIDGDGLVCWARKQPNAQHLQDLKYWLEEKFNEVLAKLEPSAKTRAEIQHLWINGEKRALRPAALKGESTFGSVELSYVEQGIKVNPSDSIAFAYSNFEKSAGRLLSLHSNRSR